MSLFCLVLSVAGTAHPSSTLHTVGLVFAVWMLTAVSVVAVLVCGATLYRGIVRLKANMVEKDSTLPLPFFNRRRQSQDKFSLSLTRRQMTLGEGAALEKLHHAIDYLIQSYSLDEFANKPLAQRPAEFFAAELLLQSRAEMLGARPPMPSFFYLLQRRIAYLMVPAK